MRPYQPQKPESHGLQGHTPQSSRVFRRFPAKYPDIGLNSVTPLLLRFSRWSRWHALSSYSQPFSHLRICSGESSWNNYYRKFFMIIYNIIYMKNIQCHWRTCCQNSVVCSYNATTKQVYQQKSGRLDIQWYMQQSINECTVCRFSLKLRVWSVQQLSHISYTNMVRYLLVCWSSSKAFTHNCYTSTRTELLGSITLHCTMTFTSDEKPVWAWQQGYLHSRWQNLEP